MRLNYVAVVVSNRLLYCTSQRMAVLRMFTTPTATQILALAIRQ